MDRRGGAGALAVPAWPSMARPGARARSGEGACESAFFRVVCKGVGWDYYSVYQLTLLAGNTAGHALTAGSHKQALRHASRTRRPRYIANAYSTVQGVQGAVPVRSAHIRVPTHARMLRVSYGVV